MKTVIPIPLDKEPDVAALLADIEPGGRVYACFTVKSKDDQTAMLRLSEMAATRDELPSAEDDSDEDDEEADISDESEKNNPPSPPPPPEKSRGEKMVESMHKGDGY